MCRRASPDAALFVGSGKADEIKQSITDLDLELIIFNHALSPAQQRNLERVFECRVVDRTSLILDSASTCPPAASAPGTRSPPPRWTS